MNRMILLAVAALWAAAPATAQQTNRVTVVFEADSDALSSEAQAQIAAFARNHKTGEGMSVKVEGHGTLAESVDNSSGYAVGLAHRRAGNVRSALVEQGVPPSAVVAAAFGASRPIEGVPAASARNRRVEIFITGDTGW